jgi:hypothetical protein
VANKTHNEALHASKTPTNLARPSLYKKK